MAETVFKVIVTFERRDDGGIRAYCDEVPGLVLSSNDVDGLIADVPEALSLCLSHTLNARVSVGPLVGIKEALANRGILPTISSTPGPKEFLAHIH